MVSESQPWIPIDQLARILNPAPPGRRWLAVLSGYFDESYNEHTFVVAGWVGRDNELARLGNQWGKYMHFLNRNLEKTGRPLLSRYHAADCSSRVNEYAGWPLAEQIDHSSRLLQIITRREIWAVGCGVPLKELVEVFPSNAHDYLEQAYYVCLRQIMITIGLALRRFAPQEKIAIIHDRTNHDAGILTCFQSLLSEPRWKSRPFFTTIAPMGWQDCVQLQPADLIAYEIFKAIENKVRTRRTMRRFLQKMLGTDMQMSARYYDRSALETLSKIIDEAEAAKASTGPTSSAYNPLTHP